MRAPDKIIGGIENPYMLRWHLVRRNKWFNVYLHKFLRSDDDRALHSHPCNFNISILLKGCYIEVTPEDPANPTGRMVRTFRRAWRPSGFVFRYGPGAHRIALLSDWQSVLQPIFRGERPPSKVIEPGQRPCWTLFITGRVVRDWGFFCRRGFVHWREFTDAKFGGTGERVGPGCGVE